MYATFNFSLNLSTVLIYVTAIFDACAVDTRAAATLRLSPLQAAALVSCGVVVLSAYAGYVVSEQRRPSKQAARAAFLSMVFSNQFCFIVVGRLVWVARRKARSDDRERGAGQGKKAPRAVRLTSPARVPARPPGSPKKEFKAALRAALWRLVARGCLTLQTTAA